MRAKFIFVNILKYSLLLIFICYIDELCLYIYWYYNVERFGSAYNEVFHIYYVIIIQTLSGWSNNRGKYNIVSACKSITPKDKYVHLVFDQLHVIIPKLIPTYCNLQVKMYQIKWYFRFLFKYFHQIVRENGHEYFITWASTINM